MKRLAHFEISKLETIHNPGDGIQSGKKLSTVGHDATVNKLDPNNGKFEFFVWNSGDHFAQIGLPKTVKIDGKEVQIKLASYTDREFMVLPPRLTHTGSDHRKTPPAARVLTDKPPTLTDLFKSGFPNTLRVDGTTWSLMSNNALLISGPTKIYLDFYGKPNSLPSISLDQSTLIRQLQVSGPMCKECSRGLRKISACKLDIIRILLI